MTRIITVTSGLAGVGKTQLAINLGLELVRRGGFVGLFSDRAAAAALADLLCLPEVAGVPQRRAEDAPASDVETRGYQGLDLLGCRVALDDWPGCDEERFLRCSRGLDRRDGYDDLLLDTSGMSVPAVLASCLCAHIVLVVVTPEPATRAHAFALLRILRLNGFAGQLHLVVNRAQYTTDGQDIRQLLEAHTRKHLSLELPLLATVLDDSRVRSARQYRHAFSTVFPESEASGCIVTLVDQLEEIRVPAARQQQLADFWNRLRGQLGDEVRLSGSGIEEPVRMLRAGPAS